MKNSISATLQLALMAARKIRPHFSGLRSQRHADAETQRESAAGALQDHPIDRVVKESLQWLKRAQDNSSSCDGGIARDFTLGKGWNRSYPETTGYIIPTFIREARCRKDADLLRRARAMLDWLVDMQMPCGGFQGGVVGASPVVPVTFNTGQILVGLASGTQEFGEPYRTAMCRAADWLVATQGQDGCWRKNPTPFAEPGMKVYETHVALGLFEAARVQPNSPYADAAMRNIRWALSYQTANGWLQHCCLTQPAQPLTHTIGYALRGILEGYCFSGDGKILAAARRTAESLLGVLGPDGFLPGRLDASWRGTVSWSCLTGTAQIAICWLLLYKETGDVRFRDAAYLANQYVRRRVRVSGPEEMRGAVKGSFPVAGDYCRFQYPNWACKFFIDSNSLEKAIREKEECDVEIPGMASPTYAGAR